MLNEQFAVFDDLPMLRLDLFISLNDVNM